MKAFWFHYNKPQSQRQGHPVMTVHYKGQCLMVRNIVCSVPVRSRERNTQPRMVIAGVGNVHVQGDTAFISGDN